MLYYLLIISLNNNNIKENQLTYCKIKPVLIAFLALTSSIIRGDNRSYVWTYEYKIMERGKAEFEHYLTFKAPKMDSLAGSVTTLHNIEFEFGMNDKFDFSIYQPVHSLDHFHVILSKPYYEMGGNLPVTKHKD